MKRTLFAMMFLAACGGDDGTSGADAGPDAGTQPDASAQACTCLALGADYMAGVGTLAKIELPSLQVTTNLVAAGISGDPVVRVPGDGKIYIINRYMYDNVTILDQADFSLIAQFSTGAGSNPQDIAVHGDKAFVVGLDLSDVQVYDLTDTSAAPALIDISSFDPDGMPNAASISILGERAFVTLGLLDSMLSPQGLPGKVIILDVNQNTVTGSFDLDFQNPSGFLRQQGNDLLVSAVDDYSGTTGCLERITAGITPGASCEVLNSNVMGTVNAIAPDTSDIFMVVTSYDPSFNPLGRIVHVQGTTLTDVTPAAQVVTDAAYCAATGQLVYNDQATGGVRVWNLVNGSEDTTAAIDVGLPAGYSNGITCY